MKISCGYDSNSTSGPLILTYTYDYSIGIWSNSFHTNSPIMITNRQYELVFTGCLASTNMELRHDNLGDNKIDITVARRRRLLLRKLRSTTIDASNPKMNMKRIFGRFILKPQVQAPKFLNLRFAKQESEFTMISKSTQGIKNKRILYKITNTTVDSFTMTIDNYTPDSRIVYAIDKGTIDYISLPTEVLTENKLLIYNPHVYRNDLLKDEIFFAIGIEPFRYWESSSYNYTFDFVENVDDNEDDDDDGPNLIALWLS